MAAVIAFFRLAGPRLSLHPQAMWLSLAFLSVISLVALVKLPAYPHPRFGLANAVTSFRAAITSMIGGVTVVGYQSHQVLSQEAIWLVLGSAAAALLLDGCDGYLARRSGTSSRYGARFDMEIDALMILFLSAAVVVTGKAGAWVLLIGLMRYGLMLGQIIFERLSGELPVSLRRKTVCVIQGIALCLGLAPVIHPHVTTLALAAALLSLIWSFALDLVYLWQQARARPHDA